MPLDHREVIRLLADLSDNEDLKVALTSSIKGGLLAGLGAVVGGLMLGRAGLPLGGAIGGLSYAIAGQEFKAVSHVLLNDLTSAQQAVLVNRVNNIVRSIGLDDVILLSSLAFTNEGIRRQLVQMIGDFIRTELNLALS